MKKLNKTSLALGVALAISASNALAVGSFEASGSQSVGVEAASAGNLVVPLAGTNIVLQTGANYPTGAGARLTITLSNGATFADSSYTLQQSGSADLTEWTQEGTDPTGLSEIKFILAASNSGGLAPGSDFILGGSLVNGNVYVNAPALAAGGAVTVGATYTDSPTTTVETYTAGDLLEYANEFSAGIDGIASAIVDVNDNRLTFTGGLSSDGIALDFYTNGVSNGISLADTDTVDIVLSGDMSDIASIGVESGAGGGVARGNMTIDTATNTATFSMSASDAFLGDGSAVFAINTTGSSALATRTFTIQADANFETETDKNLIAEATSAGSWTINGLQAKVSHMSLNSTGFVSWLKVVNEGTTDAEVTADIIWTLADGTEGAVTGAILGSVDAGGVATVGEATILSAMGDPTQLADVSMTVTVAGQVDLVHLVAEKKASDGRLPIPVYYNLGGANPRNWVQ